MPPFLVLQRLLRRRGTRAPPPPCRVCLQPALPGEPIFSGLDNTAEEIRQLACVQLTEDDGFPQHICDSCKSLLQSAILFRQTAQSSDQKLRKAKNYVTEDTTQMEADSLEISNDFEDDKAHEPSHSDTDCSDGKKNKFNLFCCKKCNIDFENHKEYFTHRKSEEHKRSKVQCPVCKVIVSSFYLNVHITRLHTKDRPYVCDVCGKSFAVQGAFKRHAVTHTDELPFKCSECPYRGRFAESLRMHTRVHTGEKPYACEQCPARFMTKSNLNKHSRSHLSEFEFKCEECSKGVHTRRDLQEHMKVQHAGLREHVCRVCGKEFGYRKAMMKHQRRVHRTEKQRSGRLPLYLQLHNRTAAGVNRHDGHT